MRKHHFVYALIIIATVVVVFLHLWQLDTIPKGLYSDESSIGLNAWMIATEGVDEHGVAFPLYFEAFGEYKNPLYIYATAVIFKLIGPSPFSVRLTSALFFFIFLFGLCWLGYRLFPKQPWIILYLLIAGGTLPWFFTYSRISFEAISQLTMFALALVFIHRTFCAKISNQMNKWTDPLLAGLFTGLSVYAYTTSRMLTFLFMFIVIVTFVRKFTLKSSIIYVAAFSLTVLPYGLYFFGGLGQLTQNFNTQTYVFMEESYQFEKIIIFAEKYLSHFHPDFLFLKGDWNLRHATGVGGELFIIVAILAVVALFAILLHKSTRTKFAALLLFGLLISPVASALTNNTPHATRSLLVGMFILILSGYGFMLMSRMPKSWWRGLTMLIVFLALVAESFVFSQDYFLGYANRSILWFEGSNLTEVLKTAYEQQPQTIIVAKEPEYKQPSTQLAFHLLFTPPPDGIEVKAGDPILRKDTCLILFSQSAADFENPDQLPFKALPPIKDNILMLRCA